MPNKRYIAFIADGQLGKRLYGLEDTYQDWLNAFRSAGKQIAAKADEVEALVLLGDTFDADALYPTEIHTAQQVVGNLRALGIPVYGILGNHDKGQSDIRQVTSWLDVCGIIPMMPTAPITLEAGTFPSACLIGLNHQGKGLLATTLKEMKKPEGKFDRYYLCLHQALEELAPHKGAGELTCGQVPTWFNRVFMGDFHNASAHTDVLGRTFLYPGSIETVSFNQDKEPGFILFDRKTELVTHLCTRQREYIKVDWSTGLGDFAQLKAVLEASALGHDGRKPVIQITYPTTLSKEVDEAYTLLRSFCLRIVYNPMAEQETNKLKANLDTEEEIVAMAASLLPKNPAGDLGHLLLRTPHRHILTDWQSKNFPKAQRKPK